MISRFIGLVFCIIFASTVCVRPAASSSGNGNYYAHSPVGYPAIQGYPSVSYLRVFPNGRDILPDDKLCKILSYAECGDVHALNKILYDNLTMDPNQDYWGARPIDAAIQNGHTDCVRLFCYYFLINDYYQGSVEPPLFRAIACHQNEIAKMLILEYGADIEAKNIYGERPLHYAAMCDNEEMCHFLISCGACIDACDFRDVTPVQVAHEEKNNKAATILKSLNDPEFLRLLKDVDDLSIDNLTFLQGFIEGQECQ